MNRAASTAQLRTTAGGVESEAQLAYLCAKGCDEAQGHLFGEPLPAAQFENLVRERYQYGER